MKCIIQCIQPLRNRCQIITLAEDKVYFDDGRYERVILSNRNEINQISSKLYEILFTWKQEYIGERVYDGERYLIELDVNHKRKKYKIQNKFPDNWDEFLLIKKRLVDLSEE